MQVTYTEKTGKTKIRVELDNGDSFVMNERDWNRLDLNTGESVDESWLCEFYRDYFLPKAKQKALSPKPFEDERPEPVGTGTETAL